MVAVAVCSALPYIMTVHAVSHSFSLHHVRCSSCVASATMKSHSLARCTSRALVLALALPLLQPPLLTAKAAAIRAAPAEHGDGATPWLGDRRIIHGRPLHLRLAARVPDAVESAARRWTQAGQDVLAELVSRSSPVDAAILSFEASVAASARLLETAMTKLAIQEVPSTEAPFALAQPWGRMPQGPGAMKSGPVVAAMRVGPWRPKRSIVVATDDTAMGGNKLPGAHRRRRRNHSANHPPCPRSQDDWMKLIAGWGSTTL